MYVSVVLKSINKIVGWNPEKDVYSLQNLPP